MSVLSTRWLSQDCPAEDGLFLADDTYVPLAENLPQLPLRRFDEPLGGKRLWSRLSLAAALLRWPGFVLFGGETSWEGEGFLALVREEDHSLVWVLRSTEAEGFRSAQLAGDLLIAISAEYPRQFRWEIPLREPWCLKVFEEEFGATAL